MTTVYKYVLEEFIKNNKEIQEVIIPSIKKEVEELAKTEIFRLKQKYGIDDVSQVTEEKLNEINKEYSDWYNNELNDRFTSNKEIKNLQKAFGINFNKTIGEDYKRFNKVDQSSSVGNFVSRGVLALEDISNSDAYSPVAQVAAQVLASPINLLRQVETSGQKAGINMQGFFNQDKLEYHDKEWGVPVYEDAKIFEFLLLETFQAGLSWITILRKRENFRVAFDNFDFQKIAKYTDEKLAALKLDAGIIRNTLKIKAAKTNAIAFMEVQKEFGTFSKYLWE